MAIAEKLERGAVRRAALAFGAMLALVTVLVVPASLARPAGQARFDLAAFFDGTSVSAGEVRTLWFRPDSFTARFTGRRTGDRVALDEQFAFADGTPLQRWDLAVSGGRISGTVSTERSDGTMAAPVPVEGELTAKGAVLRYEGIAPGGGRFTLSFRHEMIPNGDGTVHNHVRIGKFGLPLATSDVTFAKTAKALDAHLSGR